MSYVVRCALLSVSDKEGIVELARALQALQVKIFSTGGTAILLEQQGIVMTPISDVTQYPEMMGGRVKTLHPKIHGGILARRDLDRAEILQYEIECIDLVVVDLYPFQAVTKRADCTLLMAIENIDIGGPALIRSAAKNYQDVSVVVDKADYQTIAHQLQNNILSLDERFRLAKKAFAHVAEYDIAIANYFSAQENKGYPDNYFVSASKKQNLRYGENPHQSAAFYIEGATHDACTIANAVQHQGKE